MRSNRARSEVVPVHPIWYILMILTMVVIALLIVPYYFMALWPRAKDMGQDSNTFWNATETRKGVEDSFYTSWAGGMAGFTVEPNVKRYKAIHPDNTYVDYTSVDPQASWRINEWNNKLDGPHERLDSFVITSVSEEGKQAFTKDKKQSYPIRERTQNDIKEQYVDLSSTLGASK